MNKQVTHRQLIQHAKVYDRESPFHLKTTSILVEKGKIAYIGPNPPSCDCVLKGKGLGVSPGWIDLQADFCDPGFEHRETLITGMAAAHAGGYVGVCLWPTTQPTLQTKSQLKHIQQVSKEHPNLKIYPFASLSKNRKGKQLTDMLELHEAGAFGFTDGEISIENPQLLVQALRYARGFSGLIIHRSEESQLGEQQGLHEGKSSLMMGMIGSPAVGERIRLYRDLNLLAYTQGRLHVSGISTAEGVELVAEAKNAGLQVSCDVSIHHLMWNEENVLNFDPNYKVSPPYRSEKDQQSLLQGLKKGIIDSIVSAHTPCDIEDKTHPFPLARPGVLGLQTLFSSLNQLDQENKLSLDISLPILASGGWSVLGLKNPCIKVGEPACLSVFDTNTTWTWNKKTNKSLAYNHPLFGEKLKGIPVATFQGSDLSFCYDKDILNKT
ncbi:MAG: dihydroorotase [Cytophagales bacterium]|nr:dihydroorotase [Cytophagales bacterium]